MSTVKGMWSSTNSTHIHAATYVLKHTESQSPFVVITVLHYNINGRLSPASRRKKDMCKLTKCAWLTAGGEVIKSVTLAAVAAT